MHEFAKGEYASRKWSWMGTLGFGGGRSACGFMRGVPCEEDVLDEEEEEVRDRVRGGIPISGIGVASVACEEDTEICDDDEGGTPLKDDPRLLFVWDSPQGSVEGGEVREYRTLVEANRTCLAEGIVK